MATLSCMSVPQRRDDPLLRRFAAGAPSLQDGFPAGSCYTIRTVLDGNGPFGVVAQSQAGHSKHGGFLLDSTGISEYSRAFHLQMKEVKISKGGEQVQDRTERDTGAFEMRPRAGMNGPVQRQFL